MKYEELILINTDRQRCSFCDMTLIGSVWRGVRLALVYKDTSIHKQRRQLIEYYCVNCIVKNERLGKKKHKRSEKELDFFVDTLFSQKLRA